MITEKEKRLIGRYYVYPSIAMAAIIIDLLIGFWWAFLVMLDDMAFDSTVLYMPGLLAGEYEDPERLRQIQGMHSAGKMLNRFVDASLQKAGGCHAGGSCGADGCCG